MGYSAPVATLADVARRAGVSTATVSRIINNSPKPVAEALRERVLAAVAELQFVPNANAQQLARADRSAVGVIVHDVSDPYFAEITRGLQRVATDHGRAGHHLQQLPRPRARTRLRRPAARAPDRRDRAG
nr:hypothetical protein GCM10020092_060710 [Actinoplanes digitatis]